MRFGVLIKGKNEIYRHKAREEIIFLKYLKITLDKTKMLCYNSGAIDNEAIEM